MKKAVWWALLVAIFWFSFLASGCNVDDKEILVIYSARNENFVRPVLDQFEKEFDAEVKLLSGREELVNRIVEERDKVRADIFLSNDAGAMEYLRLEGLLEENSSEVLTVIDERFRAPDGSWVGLSGRSRILIYNRDKVSAEELPSLIWDLQDPRWSDQFMITRGGNSSMISHIAALRVVWGEEKTRNWLEGIRENSGAVVRGHTDIRRSVGAGEYNFGLVNNYYYHLQKEEERNHRVGAVYPDQGEGDMGLFLNVAGAALIKNAPNEALAREFIDWILEPPQQKKFTYASRELPLLPEIETVEGAPTIDELNIMEVHLSELGPLWQDTRRLIEETGLDLDL